MNGNNTDTDSSRRETLREGLRHLHAGQPAQAEALLLPLHLEAPEDTLVALNLGGAYILQEKYDQARDLLERVAEQNPDNADVWVNLAAARLGPLETSEEQQQEGAIHAYHRALAVRPDAENVHYMLGLIYRARKDNNRAAAHFTRALEQQPQDKDAQRMLAAIARESAR